MLYGVIDVGSNSVRLMLSNGDRTLYKKIKTTRLAEGLSNENLALSPKPIERTAQAVLSFIEQAKIEHANEIYVFATAAVRQATNGQVFCNRVKELSGFTVDVVDGQTEAFLGLSGALDGKDGLVLDIGGASTEIIVSQNKKITYSKSLDVGVVRLNNLYKQDKEGIRDYLSTRILEFGIVPSEKIYVIGGTATTVAALLLELEPYDPLKVDGFKIKREDLSALVDKLFSLSIDQRKELKGMHADRAEVIAGGALELLMIMDALGQNICTVSERDNLEGYVMLKRSQDEKKR